MTGDKKVEGGGGDVCLHSAEELRCVFGNRGSGDEDRTSSSVYTKHSRLLFSSRSHV